MRFILELAEFQNDLHQVNATEESLERSITFDPDESEHLDSSCKRPLVSPSRPARCLLVFNKSGAAVGMAIYSYSYVTWRAQPGIYLEDFYVCASERGKGYGKGLIGALIEEVRAVGGTRLEWRVLDWNEASIRFYKAIGATKMEGWMDMTLVLFGRRSILKYDVLRMRQSFRDIVSLLLELPDICTISKPGYQSVCHCSSPNSDVIRGMTTLGNYL